MPAALESGWNRSYLMAKAPGVRAAKPARSSFVSFPAVMDLLRSRITPRGFGTLITRSGVVKQTRVHPALLMVKNGRSAAVAGHAANENSEPLTIKAARTFIWNFPWPALGRLDTPPSGLVGRRGAGVSVAAHGFATTLSVVPALGFFLLAAGVRQADDSTVCVP